MAKEIIFTDRVRIYDTDAQGIVHYAGYYRFFTDAAESFMRDTLGVSYPLLDSKTWFVVVESEAKYYKSAKLRDELSVMLNPRLLSEKVLRFDFEIHVNGALSCGGHITQVSIDKLRWRAKPIPKNVLEKIRSLGNAREERRSGEKRKKRNAHDAGSHSGKKV